MGDDIYSIQNIYSTDRESISNLEDRFSSDKYEIFLKDERFNSRSIAFIDTYNEVYRRSFKNRLMGCGSSLELENIDYSQLVSSMAKVFELEMNLSYVQWMRMMEGIEMPQYYNVVKSCEIEIKWGGDKINFNMRDPNNANGLKSIPIGTAYSYASEAAQHGKYPREIKNIKGLLTIWNKLRVIRNEASHTNILQKEDFLLMHNLFVELIDSGHFKNLLDLGSTMRGERI